MKGIGDMAAIVMAVILLVGVVAFMSGKIPGFTTADGGAGDGVRDDTLGEVFACGQDKLATLEVRLRDTERPSAIYLAEPLSYIENGYEGKLVGSVTTTAGTAGAFAAGSDVLNCGKTYGIMTVNDGTVPFIKCGQINADEAIERVSCLGTNSSEVDFNVYTLAFGNETNGAAGLQDFTSTNAQTVGTGSVTTFRFDAGLDSGTESIFGAYDRTITGAVGAADPSSGGRSQNNAPIDSYTGEQADAYVCIGGNPANTPSSAVSISFPGVVKKSSVLPRYCASNALTNSRNFLTAYVIKSQYAEDGRVSGTVTVGPHSGNPGANDDVQFLWVDVHAVLGADGLVRIDTSTESGTDIGETNRYWEMNLA